MKIALVCSQGGHLSQMLNLMEAFKNHNIFFITYENSTIKRLKYKKYQIKIIGTNVWRMIKSFFLIFKILIKEKPELIISTGSEIAIPSCILGRFMGIKTIYIETWCRVKTKSGTGKIVYFFSNIFLVQWPDLAKKYGKKAKYKGAVV